MSRPFAAKYPGKCGGCGDPFDKDDMIQYDDDGVLVALDGCEESDNLGIPRPRQKACRNCFTIHAGECL